MDIDDLFEKHSTTYFDANEQKTEVLTKRRFERAISEMQEHIENRQKTHDERVRFYQDEISALKLKLESEKQNNEVAVKAFGDIQEYQMQKVQLARTTDVYKIAETALRKMGKR